MPGDIIVNKSTLAVIAITESVDGACADLRIPALKTFADAAGAPFLNIADLFDDGCFELGIKLSDGIASLQKRSLVIGGGTLEGAVTQTAVHTLLNGYDVFVPADLCFALENDLRPILFDRIRDSGGVVTTQRQLVLELLAQTTIPAFRKTLEIYWASLADLNCNNDIV